jgi:hypothetical protein
LAGENQLLQKVEAIGKKYFEIENKIEKSKNTQQQIDRLLHNYAAAQDKLSLVRSKINLLKTKIKERQAGQAATAANAADPKTTSTTVAPLKNKSIQETGILDRLTAWIKPKTNPVSTKQNAAMPATTKIQAKAPRFSTAAPTNQYAERDVAQWAQDKLLQNKATKIAQA